MTIKFKFYLYFILVITLTLTMVISWKYNHFSIIIWLLLFIILFYFVHKDFLTPLDNINTKVIEYHHQHHNLKGNSFKQIEKAIDNLASDGQHIYDDMERILNKQVVRLSKKTASLEILYGVSEKINTIDNTKELFKQFLQVFIDMTGARGGIGREVSGDKLKLITQLNTSIADIEVTTKTPCTSADGVQFSVYDCASCTNNNGVGAVFIPLNYKDKNLGAFALFFDTEPSLAYDERLLIQSIASSVAIYLDKLKQANKIKEIEVAQEKYYLSQEIHDSLAQTIYSLNLQISVLANLVQDQDDNIKEKVALLKNNVAIANQELRDLIDSFRDEGYNKNIAYELENIIKKFTQETTINLYSKIDKINTSTEKQQQIMRIISESLTNIKKHSQAKNVRLVYTNNRLLIEDDGVGFTEGNKDGHIGLKVMRERAERIGAQINIESEIGEGVRVIVNYD